MELLIFGETIRSPDIRTLYNIRDVVADREWIEKAENFELYRMYRELSRNNEELMLMREFGLRYDITVIPPAKLGKEYVKTAGHYHPKAPKTDVSYTEIYQILEGSAIYLLQKASGEGSILDVAVVEAKKGILSLSRLITGISRLTNQKKF